MNTWDMFGEGKEKPTPHEKFKRGVKAAGYDMDAGAKRLEDLLAKQKAERDAREKEQKNVSESQGEVDYDDDYQDMVRRVRDKAKAADALKAQGKEPQTKFNPKTGKYYVDHGQDKQVKENAEELNIGDPIIITGNVEFEGKTGEIVEFGRDKRFVIVDLYNHGKHSFHSSDVAYNDHVDHEDDMDEAGYGRNRGYTPGFASPHAPSLGGRGHREDDEGWGQEQQALTTTWYIRVNGKIIKDKMKVPYQYRGKEAARKAAQTMMAKSFNAGKKFTLTTKAEDDQPENEARLHTEYKRNRFTGVQQRDQAQDELSNIAMNRVSGMDESKERCPQCGMTGCTCKPGTCKCKPIKGWVPNKGFRDAVDEAGSAAQQAAIAINMKKHHNKPKDVDEGKKPDNYHIVNKDGKPASLASYADQASAVKDRDAKHPGAEVRQVGPRGKVKSVAEERTETKNEKGEVTSWRDESDWRKVSKDKDGRGRVTNLSDKARRATETLKKEKSVDEGWKSALGGAALAGAMSLGGGAAYAQSSGEDFLPDIVAHVTFKVNGNTVTKDINLGTSFKSPGDASAALEKFLKSKGIKFYNFSLERVSDKEYNNNYLDKSPASAASGSGSMDDRPYRATGSNDDYMAKESIDEAIENYLLDLADAGYGVMAEEKVRLDPKCWTGKKIGNPKTKMKGGVRVNNCVPK